MNNFTFKPVDTHNYTDLEKLFESKGGPNYCWCMVWRKMEKGKDRSNKTAKKLSFKKYISSEIPVGLLCYHQSEPVAWCSVAPRESYRNLSGNYTLNHVWSIVCFFIRKEYRNQGLTHQLINQAIKYAKDNGAKYVEAYPVDPDSPSYRFMGFKPAFDNFGFDFQHKAGQRRYVMTLKL